MDAVDILAYIVFPVIIGFMIGLFLSIIFFGR